MQLSAFVGEVIGGLAARANADGNASSLAVAWHRSVLASERAAHSAEHSALGSTDWWLLAFASLLALLAVGGAAGRVTRQLARRSTPELIGLLDESAAFYARWPEDRLASAPRGELLAEAARCRQIIGLLEQRTPFVLGGGPAERGPIDGLQAWIALLSNRIDGRDSVPSGTAYA